jgi:pimeloyl-ACP methyl ester carboxylesterase
VEHVVYLPGVGCREWLFGHQVTHLGDVSTAQVLVLDRQATRADMVDHVLAQAPQRFSLVGHALGGWVAQAVAAAAPDRVGRLFLSDTWTREPVWASEVLRDYWTAAEEDLDEVLNSHVHVLLHESRHLDTEFCTQLARWQRQTSTDGYVRQLKALAADYSTQDLLPRISADTLVIHGRQDRIVPEAEARFVAAGIAGARLALIEDSGHLTPLEQPQAFTAVLRLWLTRDSAA